MSILQNSNAISAGGYLINNSLRLRASASAYLNRTFGTPTNGKIWTLSIWLKRGALSSLQSIMTAQSGVSEDSFAFLAGDTIRLFFSAYSASGLITNAVFRDPSAWYHIVLAVDTTQATASNRVKLYVNGTQQTFTGSDYPAQNATPYFNTALTHYIARYANQTMPTGNFDGYNTETNFIDGQALTPSSFGETDTTTGVWKPKAYTGTYGTNGFYLKFSDIATTSGSNAGLGKDFSGNGNYFNTNNISVTSGTTYDAMIDSPTNASASGTQPVGNYATLNPNAKASSITLSEANLKSVDASGSFTVAVFATQTVFDKCYWEFQITNVGANAARGTCGVLPSNYTPTTFANDTLVAGITALGANSVGMCPQVSAIYQNGATTGISTGSWVANDVIMIAYNNGKLWMGRNGTWANSGDPAAGTGEVASGLDTSAMPVICNRNSQTWYANFGQRPFAYTPPTGFQALCTTNLPDSTIVKGNKYMDATLYTGNGSTLAVTNAGSFKPDMVWLKCRSTARNHNVFDSNRGVTKRINPNLTDAEDTASGVTSFDTGGFTLGSNTVGNTLNDTYVGWQWQAGQGTTSSNTNGSITSTVSVNATAGFSIVTYTGNATTGATVGHGLGVKPAMVILKDRTGGIEGWPVWQKSLASESYFLRLNETSATFTAFSNRWTAFSSTTITLGNNTETNGSGYTYVAYCFAEIAGFSKFGSYTGNGSADGPFIYTGFRPKFVMVKTTSNAGYNWNIHDTARNPSNSSNLVLYPNTSGAEDAYGAGSGLDILSNGFKPRDAGGGLNGSGFTYIYMAFAENPFGVNCRAR